MKILLHGINFFPEPTGIGKYTGEWANFLSNAGHEVRVITAPPHYPAWRVWDGYQQFWYHRDTHSPNLTVIRCPLWVPANPTGLTRLLHLLSFGVSSLPIVLWQRFWKPDLTIVIVPTLACAPGVLLAMRGSNVKCIVHVQDLEVDAAFELGLLRSRGLRGGVRAMERWLFGRFDMVSSISRGMLERLRKKGVPMDKLMLLPNWFDTDQIQPEIRPLGFRFEWGLDENQVIALYAGSIGEKQGLEVLLEAAADLKAQKGVTFVICSEGPAFLRLKEKYGLLSNVIWDRLVPPERLNDLLLSADIHLLPQRADAADLVMPSKLTGMLASGRPVLATAAPGTQLAEVVEGRGLVVPPGDVKALVSGIRQLASDPESRRTFGRAAREYAVNNLDRDKILASFEGVLSRLVSSS